MLLPMWHQRYCRVRWLRQKTVNDAAADSISLDTPVEEEEAEQQVQIDWVALDQGRRLHHVSSLFAGDFGFGHYDQRFFTSTRGRLAPKNLAEKVNACIARKDYDGAVDLCKKEFFYFRQFARLYRGASGCRLGNGMSDCRRYGGAGYPGAIFRVFIR